MSHHPDPPDSRLATFLATWWHGDAPLDLGALQSAVEALPLAVIVLELLPGGQPRLVAWNAAYGALLGWSPQPTPLADLPYRIYAPDRTTLVAPDALPGPRAARSGAPVPAMPVHVLRADGSWRVISTSAAPLGAGADGARRAVAVLLDVSEAHEAQALRSRLDLVSSRIRDAIAIVRPSDLRILDVNDAGVALWGYPREELVGMDARLVGGGRGAGAERVEQDLAAAASGGGALLQMTHSRKDGTTFPAEVSIGPATLEGERVLVAVVRDVSDRVRVSRALLALTRCSEVLVRAATEQQLLEDVCRVIVEEAGYRMCWVGLLEHDARRTVRPVAWAGHEEGYLAIVDVVWSDTERGRGPTGTAARTGRPAVGFDFLRDSSLAPWAGEALRRGYRSTSAIPLSAEGRTFGVLTLHTGDPGTFVPDEVAFLEQLAADLAYGVSALRAKAERARSEERLRRSREELRALAARLDAVREEEKARIARDLHDEMGQVLTGLRIDLDLVEERLEALPAEVVGADVIERVVDASELAARAVEAMRSTLATLRPAALDRLGLAPALRQECRLFEERTGVACTLDAADGLAPAPAADTALFRIAQEALTNVARHARARRVALQLWQDGADLVLTVADDGQGLPAADPAATSSGLGLLGMRERAERLGGAFSLEPAEEGGTRVTARVPAAGSAAVRGGG